MQGNDKDGEEEAVDQEEEEEHEEEEEEDEYDAEKDMEGLVTVSVQYPVLQQTLQKLFKMLLSLRQRVRRVERHRQHRTFKRHDRDLETRLASVENIVRSLPLSPLPVQTPLQRDMDALHAAMELLQQDVAALSRKSDSLAAIHTHRASVPSASSTKNSTNQCDDSPGPSTRVHGSFDRNTRESSSSLPTRVHINAGGNPGSPDDSSPSPDTCYNNNDSGDRSDNSCNVSTREPRNSHAGRRGSGRSAVTQDVSLSSQQATVRGGGNLSPPFTPDTSATEGSPSDLGSAEARRQSVPEESAKTDEPSGTASQQDATHTSGPRRSSRTDVNDEHIVSPDAKHKRISGDPDQFRSVTHHEQRCMDSDRLHDQQAQKQDDDAPGILSSNNASDTGDTHTRVTNQPSTGTDTSHAPQKNRRGTIESTVQQFTTSPVSDGDGKSSTGGFQVAGGSADTSPIKAKEGDPGYAVLAARIDSVSRELGALLEQRRRRSSNTDTGLLRDELMKNVQALGARVDVVVQRQDAADAARSEALRRSFGELQTTEETEKAEPETADMQDSGESQTEVKVEKPELPVVERLSGLVAALTEEVEILKARPVIEKSALVALASDLVKLKEQLPHQHQQYSKAMDELRDDLDELWDEHRSAVAVKAVKRSSNPVSPPAAPVAPPFPVDDPTVTASQFRKVEDALQAVQVTVQEMQAALSVLEKRRTDTKLAALASDVSYLKDQLSRLDSLVAEGLTRCADPPAVAASPTPLPARTDSPSISAEPRAPRPLSPPHEPTKIELALDHVSRDFGFMRERERTMVATLRRLTTAVDTTLPDIVHTLRAEVTDGRIASIQALATRLDEFESLHSRYRRESSAVVERLVSGQGRETGTKMLAFEARLLELETLKADSNLVGGKADLAYVDNLVEKLRKELLHAMNATNRTLVETIDKSLSILRDMIEQKTDYGEFTSIKDYVLKSGWSAEQSKKEVEGLAGTKHLKCLSCKRSLEMRPRSVGMNFTNFMTHLPSSASSRLNKLKNASPVYFTQAGSPRQGSPPSSQFPQILAKAQQHQLQEPQLHRQELDQEGPVSLQEMIEAPPPPQAGQ